MAYPAVCGIQREAVKILCTYLYGASRATVIVTGGVDLILTRGNEIYFFVMISRW